MNFYSQKKYNDILGQCMDTIKRSGCFLTSLCNLNKYLKFTTIMNPSEMNRLFIKNNVWVNGCMISGPKVASFFKLEYLKKTSSDMLCIAETDHFKKVGVPQHFFLYNPEKKERVDPLDLDPQWESNTYNIVSYRIFRYLGTPTQTYANNTAPVPTEIVIVPEAPTMPQDEFKPETPIQVAPPTYEDLTSPKNQFLQIISDLWELIKKLFQSFR
jgi:hypothetical protein